MSRIVQVRIMKFTVHDNTWNANGGHHGTYEVGISLTDTAFVFKHMIRVIIFLYIILVQTMRRAIHRILPGKISGPFIDSLYLFRFRHVIVDQLSCILLYGLELAGCDLKVIQCNESLRIHSGYELHAFFCGCIFLGMGRFERQK